MSRMWIVLGDITSSGGRVITASVETDVDGKGVARINDMATCPTHKGVFPIVDGDATTIIDGQPLALHGSKLACGCMVLAMQQLHVFLDSGGATGRNLPAGAAAALPGSGTTESNTLRMASTSETERFGGQNRGRFRVGDVLKELCPDDKAVVDEMASTNIQVADEVYYEDPYYDGSKWTTRRFDAGGFVDRKNNRIVLLSNTSAKVAATTTYHEIFHKGQDTSLSWRDREIEAYTKTEEWAIKKGLPGQGGLRMKDGAGNWVPDPSAIDRVLGNYPIADTLPGEPTPIGQTLEGLTLLSDQSVRPPRRGDTYPAEPTMVGLRTIPSSTWKCDGEAKDNSDAPSS